MFVCFCLPKEKKNEKKTSDRIARIENDKVYLLNKPTTKSGNFGFVKQNNGITIEEEEEEEEETNRPKRKQK